MTPEKLFHELLGVRLNLEVVAMGYSEANDNFLVGE